MSAPRCWRCRGRLVFDTDGAGRVDESCPRCVAYIAELEERILQHRRDRNRWNRKDYRLNREQRIARVRAWAKDHKEHIRAQKRDYHRRVKLGLHTPKRRSAART